MKNKNTILRLSLQFFASDDVSAETIVQDGVASPQAEVDTEQASADVSTDGNQLEEEFEKLIKGGKYENAFKKRTQSIIDKRFRNLKTIEAIQAKQQPVIDFLSAKYGIDSSNPSLLLEKMQNESKTDSESLMDNAEMRDTQTREQLISEKADMLSKRWTVEGQELKKIFPTFDFKTELKNPAFASLLKSGMPLRKAYTAVHSDELIRNAVSGTAKKVAEQTLKSIRAQGNRVAENGLHNGAGIVRKTDVSSLTGKEIRSILKQVENGSRIRF